MTLVVRCWFVLSLLTLGCRASSGPTAQRAAPLPSSATPAASTFTSASPSPPPPGSSSTAPPAAPSSTVPVELPSLEVAHLAAHAKVLYVAGRDPADRSQVLRLREGAAPEVVWNGDDGVTGLGVSAGVLLWSTAGAVWRLQPGDAGPARVDAGAAAPGLVQVGADGAFSMAACPGAPGNAQCLFALAPNGGPRERLRFRDAGRVTAFHAHHSALWFATDAGEIRRAVPAVGDSFYVAHDAATPGEVTPIVSLHVWWAPSERPEAATAAPGHTLLWNTASGNLRRLAMGQSLRPETIAAKTRLLASRHGAALVPGPAGQVLAIRAGESQPIVLTTPRAAAGALAAVAATFDEADGAALVWAYTHVGGKTSVQRAAVEGTLRPDRGRLRDWAARSSTPGPPLAPVPQDPASRAQVRRLARVEGGVTALALRADGVLVATVDGAGGGSLLEVPRDGDGEGGQARAFPAAAGPRISGVHTHEARVWWWTDDRLSTIRPPAAPVVLARGLITRVEVGDDALYVATGPGGTRLLRAATDGSRPVAVTGASGTLPFTASAGSVYRVFDGAVIRSRPLRGGDWRMVANDPTQVLRVQEGVGAAMQPWPIDDLLVTARYVVWAAGRTVRVQRLEGGPVRELPSRFVPAASCGDSILSLGDDGTVVAHPLDGGKPRVAGAPPGAPGAARTAALAVGGGLLTWAVARESGADVYLAPLDCAVPR